MVKEEIKRLETCAKCKLTLQILKTFQTSYLFIQSLNQHYYYVIYTYKHCIYYASMKHG